MIKTKIKQHAEYSLDTFLADDDSTESSFLIRTNDSDILQNESTVEFSEKSINFTKILKQVFLYFPGTYLLLASTIVLSFNYFVWQPQNFLAVFLLIVGSLMTIAGIGDLRNPKHLLIPFSGITICGFLFLISLGSSGQNFLMKNAIYLLPIMLMVPFLAKGWIDRNNEN